MKPIQFVPLILLVVVMYFLLIRPQKKKEKEITNLRANLHVGDEIITIGGICGKIVKMKEETLVIQVGADKTKFEMMRWSVSKVVNRAETAEEPETTEEETKKTLPKRMKKAQPAETEAEVDNETTETEEEK